MFFVFIFVFSYIIFQYNKCDILRIALIFISGILCGAAVVSGVNQTWCFRLSPLNFVYASTQLLLLYYSFILITWFNRPHQKRSCTSTHMEQFYQRVSKTLPTVKVKFLQEYLISWSGYLGLYISLSFCTCPLTTALNYRHVLSLIGSDGIEPSALGPPTCYHCTNFQPIS